MNSMRARWLLLLMSIVLAHHIGVIFGPMGEVANGARIADFIDLLTPFIVIGLAGWTLLPAKVSVRTWVVFGVLAILYTNGHGMHLAANSINNVGPIGPSSETTHFWDEEFSHAWWYIGWHGLVALTAWNALAKERLKLAQAPLLLIYGFAVMTTTIEGGALILMTPIVIAIVGLGLKFKRGLMLDAAMAYGFAALLIAGFGIWQGGFPEFSQLGWI